MEQIIKNNLGYIRADIKNIMRHFNDATLNERLNTILWQLSEEYLESADGPKKEALYDKYEPKEKIADTMQKEFDEQQKKVYEDLEEDLGSPLIDHPTHYQSYNTSLQIECIDAMRAAFGDEAVAIFCKLNSFKYLWRESSKQGKVSIGKAIWYLNKYLELNK